VVDDGTESRRRIPDGLFDLRGRNPRRKLPRRNRWGARDPDGDIVDIVRFISPLTFGPTYALSHGRIDWNGDSEWDTDVAADINGDGQRTVLSSFNDWERTEIDGVEQLRHMTLDGFCSESSWVK
jgi:hypothetical protein